jgi:nicotinamide-nucleotide amidase
MKTPKWGLFLALATPDEVIVENLSQPRDKVIDSAVIKSLELLKKEKCAIILLVYRFIFFSLH